MKKLFFLLLIFLVGCSSISVHQNNQSKLIDYKKSFVELNICGGFAYRGYVITAGHCIRDGEDNIKVIKVDTDRDVAIIKESEGVPSLKPAVEMPNIGDPVVSFVPYGGEVHFLQAGSWIGLEAPWRPYTILVSMVLWPGSSGSPILNTSGELLGLVSTGIGVTPFGPSAIGTVGAVPINVIDAVIDKYESEKNIKVYELKGL